MQLPMTTLTACHTVSEHATILDDNQPLVYVMKAHFNKIKDNVLTNHTFDSMA